MTIAGFTEFLANYPFVILGFFLAPPALAGLLGVMHGKGNGGGGVWKYIYTCILYLVCFPGMFAAMLTAYTLFFRNEDLTKVNLLVYIFPVISMIVTLVLVKRGVGDFNRVPGFGRLAGLMLMLGLSFAFAFVLHRMHFGIFFLGDLGSLLTIAVIAFALMKWAGNKFMGEKEDRTLKDVVAGK
ncbi:MAG: hypothetical protein KIS92_24535 [Planctomycetota bacterium]|nr:hypothetical protein [Planctomycetota bacterium]